jgi:hypothetical protein
MRLLRVFSIIMALGLVIASSNISFKSGNDIKPGINSRPLLPDSVLLYIDDKSNFSSLLQTISAQEQEEKEQADEEEDGKDSGAITKEDQDEIGSNETKSSLGQEDSEKELQKQDEIKEDCRQEENTDSQIGSCVPNNEEKEVCHNNRGNDEARMYSEDSECSTNKNEEEEQQENKDEPEGQEELRQEDEKGASLDNKGNNTSGENPITMKEQDNNTSSNNNTSSDIFNTEDKAENSSQNLTYSHSTERRTKTTTNNSASINGSQLANASTAINNNFTLTCDPAETKMLPGEKGSIICTIENKTTKSIEMVLECSGLQDTGIECYINGKQPAETTLVKQMSSINFSVLLVSRSSPPVLAGSYPFTISANECFNSDLC